MTVRRALVLIALQCLLVFGIGFGVVATRLLDPTDPFRPSLVSVAFVLAVAFVGAFGLVYYGSVRQPRRTFRMLGWHADRLLVQVLCGILGGVVGTGIVVSIYIAGGASVRNVAHDIASSSLTQRAMFILIGGQAAFVEESLFRGNLQPLLVKRIGAVGAIAATAAVFAVYHLNPSPASLIGKFLFGLVLGALAYRQRSLVAPAIAHALAWAVVGAL